tara:strand:- start:396 stop:563 length:168 start_codon:yes stop_codon:yes gene_type:complete
MYFTDNPVEFGQFTIDQIGETNYTDLLRKRQVIAKVDWDAEVIRLTEIAKERGLL